MKTAILACALAATLSSVADARDTKLPPDVRALAAPDIINIYANKTIRYPTFTYYFGPDGHLVGYTKDRRSFGTGNWHVEGNEICMKSTWRAGQHSWSASYVSCSTWYSDGNAYWAQITRGGERGNVYKGNASLVTNGDYVSDVVSKMKNTRRR